MPFDMDMVNDVHMMNTGRKPKKARPCKNFAKCGKRVSGWTKDELCHWCKAEVPKK